MSRFIKLQNELKDVPIHGLGNYLALKLGDKEWTDKMEKFDAKIESIKKMAHIEIETIRKEMISDLMVNNVQPYDIKMWLGIDNKTDPSINVSLSNQLNLHDIYPNYDMHIVAVKFWMDFAALNERFNDVLWLTNTKVKYHNSDIPVFNILILHAFYLFHIHGQDAKSILDNNKDIIYGMVDYLKTPYNYMLKNLLKRYNGKISDPGWIDPDYIGIDNNGDKELSVNLLGVKITFNGSSPKPILSYINIKKAEEMVKKKPAKEIIKYYFSSKYVVSPMDDALLHILNVIDISKISFDGIDISAGDFNTVLLYISYLNIPDVVYMFDSLINFNKANVKPPISLLNFMWGLFMVNNISIYHIIDILENHVKFNMLPFI